MSGTASTAVATTVIAAAIAGGLLGLGSCGGQDDAPPAQSATNGVHYGQRTDGRGWAISEEGLFGHRRVLDLPHATRSGIDGIGYAQGSEDAPATTGVLIRRSGRIAPGLNLLNSGDAAEAVLMDSEGTIEHRWALPYDDIPAAPPLATAFQIPWRRVHMRPDGSLLAMHANAALVHVDRESELVWTLFERVGGQSRPASDRRSDHPSQRARQEDPDRVPLGRLCPIGMGAHARAPERPRGRRHAREFA